MSDTTTGVVVLLVFAATWAAVYWYSRRSYYLEACKACDGGGKRWEPRWMATVCLRTYRRFRPCDACGGASKFNIHEK